MKVGRWIEKLDRPELVKEYHELLDQQRKLSQMLENLHPEEILAAEYEMYREEISRKFYEISRMRSVFLHKRTHLSREGQTLMANNAITDAIEENGLV